MNQTSIANRLRMRQLLATSFLVFCTLGVAEAAERTLQIDGAKSKASFLLPATGHDVTGSFAVQSASLTFDDAAGTAAGTVGLDATKGETGNSSRDKTMHSDVLLSAKFPVISLRATRLEGTVPAAGKGQVKLHGMLNVIGKEHEVVLPTELEVVGETVKAKATLEVPFLDWGLKDPSILFLKVGKKVSVTLQIEGRLVGP